MIRDEQSVFLYDNDGHGREVIQLPLDGHIFSPLKTTVSPDGQWLAFYTGSIGNTGYDEKLPVTLNLLNLTDGTIKKVADIVTDGYQQKLEEVANNLKTLFPDFYKPFDEWDWVSSRVTSEFTWRIYSVAWSPDSHYVAFAGQIDGLSSDVYLYDIELDTIQIIIKNLLAFINRVRAASSSFFGASTAPFRIIKSEINKVINLVASFIKSLIQKIRGAVITALNNTVKDFVYFLFPNLAQTRQNPRIHFNTIPQVLNAQTFILRMLIIIMIGHGHNYQRRLQNPVKNEKG